MPQMKFGNKEKPKSSGRNGGKFEGVPEAVALAMSMRAQEGKTDVTEGYVYSTCMLAQGGEGEISLFTVPLGHLMPQLGKGGPLCSKCQEDAGLKLTNKHTNIGQAGQLGSAFGEMAVRTLRVVGDGLAAGVEGRLVVMVGGKPQYSGPLAVLLEKTRVEPLALGVPILISRYDTLDVRVSIDRALSSNEVPSGHALLRVELAGAFASDAR